MTYDAPMRFQNIRRVGVVAWPLAAGALILAACGSDAQGSSTPSTIDLKPTEYITKEPVPTTLVPIVTEPDTTGEQSYTIQSGDFPISVANKFGVPVDALLAYNDIAAGTFPFPGEVIRIPPGGTPAAATDTATADAATDSTETVGEEIPDAGDNCAAGSYVLVEGDYPGKVAANFDVTVAALEAANANTSGYSSFIVGTEIVIPAKADC